MKKIILAISILITSSAISQEIELVNFKSTDCTEERGIGDSILFKKQNGNTLIIKITAEFNCCGSVSGSIDLKKRFLKKNILNLTYEDYSEEYCNCICYFEYTYTIEGIKKENYLVYINGKEIEYTN
ncbi:hypothetical protein [Ichthyenterobacterium magnum]|uniref:Uncharacterized protein n=1 Tax=Ichthyenterobacterium magnum TaxID=1230530 RepID=A0A420DM19_9FLAO|nr:hypothetical protein [Ichthyenterobacterium magnum]RKE95199.1 hypothetical protein BXY80_1385 [Ichthyenterobacterium magnum]